MGTACNDVQPTWEQLKTHSLRMQQYKNHINTDNLQTTTTQKTP